jgi:tripartite-type tricarboxylate transporter receptor subunit TctC
MRNRISVLLALVIACFVGPGLGAVSNYFVCKNVTYIVATNAGGGYDAYARLVGGYLEKHLKAKHVVIRNVPGAGHLVGANTLARSKPDGLIIGTFNAGLIYGQLAGNKALRFDLRELGWIGKAAGEPRAIIVSTQCSIQSIEDLIASDEPIIFAGAGIGSASYADTRLLAEALNLNVRIIPGYEGTEAEMAIMRGEICGLVASTSSLETFVAAGYGRFVLAVGGLIEGVPNAIDYAPDERARRIVQLVSAMAELGRITAAPSGTPTSQLEDLRAAYRAALEDPELRAEANQKRRPIEPAYGEDVANLVASALNQPPDIIAIITRVLNPDRSGARDLSHAESQQQFAASTNN